MKPTVGSIVHYYSHGRHTEPVAALVTRLRPDNRVDLHCFPPSGVYAPDPGALNDVAYSATPMAGKWTDMEEREVLE